MSYIWADATELLGWQRAEVPLYGQDIWWRATLLPMPQYLPEPTFRDWAFRSGEHGSARMIMLHGCLIQPDRPSNSPCWAVSVSLRRTSTNIAWFGKITSQRHYKTCNVSAGKDLQGRAVPDTQVRDGPTKGLYSLITLVTDHQPFWKQQYLTLQVLGLCWNAP